MPTTTNESPNLEFPTLESPTVAIIGAGVAGLSAGCALASQGYRIHLFEGRPSVGGRAYSYDHPGIHEVIDCQHVLLGCCTNLLYLLEQTGANGQVRWYESIPFLERGGRASEIAPSMLPSPLHSAASFLSAKMLGAADKLAIARGAREFLRDIPAKDDESVEQWLRRTKQTERAIQHLWAPLLIVTLNDSFANCSTRYAGKVIRELFLKSSAGGRLGIPTLPLSEFYSYAAHFIETNGGSVHLRSQVEAVDIQPDGRWSLKAGSQELSADYVVLATSVQQVSRLLERLPQTADADPLRESLGRFLTSPYLTAHLWFDREFTDLDFAALLDTTFQWMFHKSRIRGASTQNGSYVELVIGAGRERLAASREELIRLALEELRLFFPRVSEVNLLKSAVLKEANATFSVVPGMDQYRPGAVTPWPGIFLAGDWTATGWPATMEGAARSGYLAAEAVADANGAPQKFLIEDLPPAGLMRWLDKAQA